MIPLRDLHRLNRVTMLGRRGGMIPSNENNLEASMTQTTNRSLKALVLSTSIAALSLGAVAPVAAQNATSASDGQPEVVQPTLPQIDMTDTKLEAFVAALMGVEEVRLDYTPQIEAASSEEEQAALVNQANAEIIEKIEAVPDLTVDEYVTIAQVAQQDQELGARIASLVEAESSSGTMTE